eukprot:5292810-Amphidinium_carterae.2
MSRTITRQRKGHKARTVLLSGAATQGNTMNKYAMKEIAVVLFPALMRSISACHAPQSRKAFKAILPFNRVN